MNQNSNQIKHPVTLTPNHNQSQIADVSYGGETLAQQTELPVEAASPCTLTFSKLVTEGNTVNVYVRLLNDIVESVIDDAGNEYTLLVVPKSPDQYMRQVWTSPNVQTLPTGVTITTSNGSDILSAMLSDINTAT